MFFLLSSSSHCQFYSKMSNTEGLFSPWKHSQTHARTSHSHFHTPSYLHTRTKKPDGCGLRQLVCSYSQLLIIPVATCSPRCGTNIILASHHMCSCSFFFFFEVYKKWAWPSSSRETIFFQAPSSSSSSWTVKCNDPSPIPR